MPTTITWPEIAVRLLLTALAGGLIGFDRGEKGHPAGFRTTLLVCLASCLSMIQVNLLLPMAGRPDKSFVMLDLMRLPLGILSGMGFIGAGAILRRGDLVRGVTTAATLWYVTVLGLCFGGGQLGLGVVAAGLGIGVLSGLKWVESLWPQERRATLTLSASADGPAAPEVAALLARSGYRAEARQVAYREGSRARDLAFEVRWRGRSEAPPAPEILDALASRPGVLALAWKPFGDPGD